MYWTIITLRTYLSMTLPVVKCILCSLLMFTYITPRIKEYNITMLRLITSYYSVWILLYVSILNQIFVLSDLSIKLWVRYSNMFLETRLVPISELFSFESTLSMTQVPSATFSLNHSCARSRCRRFLVICFDSDA